MDRKELFEKIQHKQSYLCMGLDPDPTLVPTHLGKDPQALLEFNRAIIAATSDLCVAYKLNLAFYETMGSRGWDLFEDTLRLIPEDQFIIADAKRGDIGNTASNYAKAFFDAGLPYRIDAVTINPYMGKDSVLPFLAYRGKWAISLALTSNAGADDFQKLPLENGKMLFEQVTEKLQSWGTPDQLMLVAGATQAAMLTRIRAIAPDHFLLVPGIGAQGGSLEEVSRYGMNSYCGLLVNVGRSILYASSGPDFADEARSEAKRIQKQMASCLNLYLKQK